jgi:hypothetical protein
MCDIPCSGANPWAERPSARSATLVTFGSSSACHRNPARLLPEERLEALCCTATRASGHLNELRKAVLR